MGLWESMKEYRSTVCLTMPTKILEILDKEVKQKKYKNRGEAITIKLQNSDHFDQLMETARNPELQKEMNQKIKDLVSSSNVEQTLETMTIAQRNSIIFYARVLNDKALTQTQIK